MDEQLKLQIEKLGYQLGWSGNAREAFYRIIEALSGEIEALKMRVPEPEKNPGRTRKA